MKTISDSSLIAKKRLEYILAYDRQNFDGRQRIAELNIQGNRTMFSTPLTVLSNEAIVMQTYLEDGELKGYAICIKCDPTLHYGE